MKKWLCVLAVALFAAPDAARADHRRSSRRSCERPRYVLSRSSHRSSHRSSKNLKFKFDLRLRSDRRSNCRSSRGPEVIVVQQAPPPVQQVVYVREQPAYVIPACRATEQPLYNRPPQLISETIIDEQGILVIPSSLGTTLESCFNR
jgi:hypothetical protein